MFYIAIIHKDKDSDFGVSFPDFPGCVTAGSTLEEAKDNAIEALNFHIEGMREDGEAIPAPSTMDAIYLNPDFSEGVAFLVENKATDKTVRVNITLSEGELAQIDLAAKSYGMNRSAFMVKATFDTLRQINSPKFFDENALPNLKTHNGKAYIKCLEELLENGKNQCEQIDVLKNSLKHAMNNLRASNFKTDENLPSIQNNK